MGVAFYIKSFPKNDLTVINELKSVGLFDVDEDMAGKYQTGEIAIDMPQMIDILLYTNLHYEFRHYDIFLSPTDFLFYILCVNYVDGYGYNNDEMRTYMLAHDPAKIVPTVESLIRISTLWNKNNHGDIDLVKTQKDLITLKDFLNESIQKNNLVSFIVG